VNDKELRELMQARAEGAGYGAISLPASVLKQESPVTDLGAFDYSGRQVRTVTRDGEPWFVAADVCAVLGIANARQAVTYLDEDEVVQQPVTTNDGSGRSLATNLVNEPGLYSLILRSRKPEAKAFKRWVTHEVLPAIRKTGRYEVAQLDELEVAERYVATLKVKRELESQVAELTPKAELADTYLIADKATRLVREAAKLLNMREIDLRRFLIDEGFIFAKHAQCGDVMYDHYAEHAHHFIATETVVNHSWGTCSHYTLRITPRGIDLIRKRLTKAKTAS